MNFLKEKNIEMDYLEPITHNVAKDFHICTLIAGNLLSDVPGYKSKDTNVAQL